MKYFIEDHPAIFVTIVFALIIAVVIISCARIPHNYQVFDTNWRFTWAIVQLGNGELIEGHVTSWRDFNESDMIQITIDDELTIMTHSSNILLCSEQP